MTRPLEPFSLKPVFIGWLTLLVQLPVQLFVTFWASIFFGGIATTFGLFSIGSRTPFIFFGVLAFVCVPIVAYLGKMLNYARTEYRFNQDQMEFDEGFFSTNRKVLKLREVREVTLHKGILQRICGLGSIYLATRATGRLASWNPFRAFGFGNIAGSGVVIQDVATPDMVFERIRALVDAQPTPNL
jgi:uncharacterized membrane protein YdbT with pleckstrin-like domain